MAEYNIFEFLKSVPEFDGRAEDLTLFIQYIEEVRQHAVGAQLTLFDLRIRHKIVGKANVALINNNNPTQWGDIKHVLKTNFTITDSIESLVNKIKTAELRTTIDNFFEYIMTLLTKLNLKANMSGNEMWYTCTNNEQMVLKIFINKLPSEPKLILHARNPNSLLQAKEILVETEYFYKNFNKYQKGAVPKQLISSHNAGREVNPNENFTNGDNSRNIRMRNSGSSQSRNSGNRFNNFDRNSGQSRGSHEGNYRRRDCEDDQVPMELGIVRPSNFQLTAEDLFPI